MGHQPKLGSYGKNRIFWAKNQNFGPKKKESLFDRNHVLGHDWKKLFKEKKCLCPNNQGGEMSFWVIKTHFLGQKTTFRPNVKTPVSPSFRPGPGPLSFWVIFLMARTIPPSFVEIGPKLG